MKSRVIALFTLMLICLYSCNSNQEQLNSIFEIYYEKYPNIHDPMTGENQVPASPYQQYEAGNYAVAISGFDSLLTNQPDQKFANFYLGLSYFETGDYQKAVSPFQNAIDSKSNLLVAPALFYSALAQLKLSKKEEAISLLNKIKKNHDYYYPRSREILALIEE